jgi:murein L,D-transpeptidase YcbB/YkuD
MTLRFTISLFLALASTLVLFTYCSSLFDNDGENNFQPTDEQRLTRTLDQVNTLELNENAVEYVIDFYEKRNYKTIWVKDSTFKDFYFAEFINNDIKLNLPFYTLITKPYKNSNTPYEKEILTLLRLSEFLDIQSKGLINFKDSSLNNHGFVNHLNLEKFINSYNSKNEWVSHLLSFGQKNMQIADFHKSLNYFTSKYSLKDKVIKVDQKDSLNSDSNKIAMNLKEKGLLSNVNISKDSLIQIFKSFQYMNGLEPDGILGANSIKALHQTNLQRYYKGVIALEKLKSIPDSLISSKYIEVNIPSFLLHFYDADTLVAKHKVIAGANKTQTPEFVAPLKYVVVKPYWHVPYSIASTEILHGARRDSNFFKKKNYILTRKDSVISPDSINWKNITTRNFPYSIKQSYGNSNSLGLLKFLFPNNHAIYIHDTPSKHLFRKEERNFSHGCIRVQNPFELAKSILKLENHSYVDSLDTLVKRDKETYLNVNDNFLVHIRYRTVIIDDSTNQIRFHNDVYGREEKYMKLFEPNLP